MDLNDLHKSKDIFLQVKKDLLKKYPKNYLKLVVLFFILLVLASICLISANTNKVTFKKGVVKMEKITKNVSSINISIDSEVLLSYDYNSISEIKKNKKERTIDLTTNLKDVTLDDIEEITTEYISPNEVILHISDVITSNYKTVNVQFLNQNGRIVYNKNFSYSYNPKSNLKYILNTNKEISLNEKIDITEFDKGITNLSIKKVDDLGHSSNSYIVPIYKIDVAIKDSEIEIADSSQEYEYLAKINGLMITNKDDLKSKLVDSSIPNAPKNLKLKDNVFSWDSAIDTGSVYSISLEGKGLTYGNPISTNTEESITSGIKEYEYKILSNGNVLHSGKTQNNTKRIYDLSSGDYTLKIRAIDNSGNISLETEKSFSYVNKFQNYDDILKNILKKEGEISAEQTESLKNSVYKLPVSILKSLQDDQFSLIITDTDITNYYNGPISGALSGLFSPSKKSIYISNQFESYNNDIHYTTLHEIGHYIDSKNKTNTLFSSSTEFNSIYDTEREMISNNYYEESSSEYFAHCFYIYFTSPDELKLSAPKTYNFIHNIIEKF